MITELTLKNLALMEDLTLSWGPGLTVLTGETGAGKSLVLNGIGLILGDRAGPSVIRTGADRASVTAVLDLSARPAITALLAAQGVPVEEDHTVVVQREITLAGKTVCRMNGSPVPVATLKALGEALVDLHGQHEHQSLLRSGTHREILDQWGGADLLAVRRSVAQVWEQRKALLAELETLAALDRDRVRQLEWREHEIEDIANARLQQGEEELLIAEREVLDHAERLAELSNQAFAHVAGDEGSAVDQAGRAAKALRQGAAWDRRWAGWADRLDALQNELVDVGHEIRGYEETLGANSGRLDEVHGRLFLIEQLKKKYGATVGEIQTYLEQSRLDAEALRHADQRRAELTTALDTLGADLDARARSLTQGRRTAARALAAAVRGELKDLGFLSAGFEAAVTPLDAVGPFGADAVEFLVSLNPGEPAKPLAQVASGGELSRVMLALKVVVARTDGIPVLIFDEIDAGLGGRAAEAVAAKLRRVAQDAQVICVTHLPLIAAAAHAQWRLDKVVEDGRTRTVAGQVSGGGRVDELGRMLAGGAVTVAARTHAKELLERHAAGAPAPGKSRTPAAAKRRASGRGL